MMEIGAVLRENLGEAASGCLPSIPNIVVRVGSLFSHELRQTAPDLDYARRPSSDKTARVLGWTARPPQEAIVAAGQSMVDQGPRRAVTYNHWQIHSRPHSALRHRRPQYAEPGGS
jgi:hypothetical protein